MLKNVSINQEICTNWLRKTSRNIDVAIRPTFVAVVATLQDQHDNFLVVNSLRLPFVDDKKGEAFAALLAI